MSPRRGLFFWALRLDRFDCWSCGRDVIYRQGTTPPLICRWCGGITVDIIGTIRQAARWIEETLIPAYVAFGEQFAALNRTMATTREELQRFRDAFQTRVDTDPNMS